MAIQETPTIPAPYLAAPSDLAARLGTTAEDPKLLQALRRTSDRFRDEVNHPVHYVQDDEIYLSGNGSRSLALPAAPVHGVPLVEVDGRPVTDFQTGRRAGLLRRLGYWPDGLDNIRITYTHGYQLIPGGIQDAVLSVAEAAYHMQAGVETVSTGNESVKFANSLVNGGTTQEWAAAVNRYTLGGNGDRS